MTPAQIIEAVANVTGIPASTITGETRTRHVARARFMAILALRRTFPSWSDNAIGELVNRHGSGTARYALIQAAKLEETDPTFAAETLAALGLAKKNEKVLAGFKAGE